MHFYKIQLFFTRFKLGFKKRIQKLFGNTYNHYLCFLPSKIGFLTTFLLNFLFANITINKSQTYVLNKLRDEGIIVYASKYKSFFEYLFYYTRYKQNGLPVPEIAMDYKIFLWQPISRLLKILLSHLYYFLKHLSMPSPYKSGYIREELLINGRTGFLSLISDDIFYRRFVKSRTDSIQYLIEMQKTVDCPIFIIPQLMLFNIRPQRTEPGLIDIILGYSENPGIIRRLTSLFKTPKKIFVEISKPVNLKKFLALPEIMELDLQQQSLALRRHLVMQTNRHRQSITGPILKSREEIKENILTREQLRKFMQSYARRTKTPLQQIHKKADGYLDEIAANYNVNWISFFKILLKWVLDTIFEGITVDEEGLEKVRLMAQRAPLILIPCHKSHLDYLILSYIFHNHKMPCPHIAAGKNLSFWPLGPIFRSGGAFFIRRSFKGAILYSKVFAAYLEKLLSEGFNIEFFIEGGRSRTGKLLMPKLGMLSLLINACKSGASDDLIFVPIFIGYDRVLEENAYLQEIEGRQKKPENLIQVIKARKFLKKRYGKVYIKFNEPISMKDLLAQKDLKLSKLSSKQQNTFCRQLGYRIINDINHVSVVTPYGIVAAAILNCTQQRFNRDLLMFHLNVYMACLIARKAPLADTLLMDSNHAFDHVLEIFIQRKFIEKSTGSKEGDASKAVFEVNANRRSILEYYKNNSVSFFIPQAFTAMAILAVDAFQFRISDLYDGYNFLQDMFINEFPQEVDQTTEQTIRKTLKFFIDEAILVPHRTLPDTYQLTSAGFRKLKVFAAFLKTYFESYRVVLAHYTQTPQESNRAKERMRKIQAIGNRMLKIREIERSEALSKINYSNAVALFTAKGIKGLEDKEKIGFYMTEIQKYLHFLSA